MSRALGITAAAAVLLASAASGAPTESVAHSSTNNPRSANRTTPVALVAPTKVLTIVEENHSYAQMRADMPYLNGLAQRYGYATNWTAITHPSLPNYLAIVGGATFGVTDDKPPASHLLRGTTVFDQALARGKTAKSYAETMVGNCGLTTVGRYAVKHNPWAYFTAGRAHCNSFDVPMTAFSAAELPNAGMIIPNTCNDAHDCSLGTADTWLRRYLPVVLASADFTSGRLTVVVTADEDDRNSGNKVLTVVMNAHLHGTVVGVHLTHYSLTRYYDQVLGAPLLGQAVGAPDMKAAFGL